MEEEQKNKRWGVTLFDENPFMMDGVKPKVKRITSKRADMTLISGETGEVISPIAGFWEAKEVDEAKFIKLYINGVKALAELTPAGGKVFALLYEEMQKNIGKDKVFIGYSEAKKLGADISQRTFSRGMAELLEKQFLAACNASVGWYWVNPDFVFNGDRLAFVREYRKVKTTKAIEDSRQPSLFPELDRIEQTKD